MTNENGQMTSMEAPNDFNTKCLVTFVSMTRILIHGADLVTPVFRYCYHEEVHEQYLALHSSKTKHVNIVSWHKNENGRSEYDLYSVILKSTRVGQFRTNSTKSL